jgi:hypothetical protein
MRFIDFGLTMLSASALAQHAEGESFDLAQAYGRLVREGGMAGLEVDHRFYEIGSRAGMAETEAYLRRSIAMRRVQ